MPQTALTPAAPGLLDDLLNGLERPPQPVDSKPATSLKKHVTNAILNNEKEQLSETAKMQGLLQFDCPEFSQWTFPDERLLRSLAQAPWKVVDVETTGLTLASEEVQLSNKELKAGDNAKLRLRIVTALWWDNGIQLAAFDLDQVHRWHGGAPMASRICDAALSGCLIAHNAGFDLGWLTQHSTQRPSLVLDTMLLARLLRPDVPLLLAEILDRGRNPQERHFYYNEIRSIFLNKGAGTWTLETLAAVLLNESMDKGYQKPRHWTRAILSEEHYNYATSDVFVTHRLVCALLGIEEDADVVAAYRAKVEQHPELKVVEPQILDVLSIREKGIPINRETARRYAEKRFADAVTEAAKMAELEPTLAVHQAALADPHTGMSQELRGVIAQAFLSRDVPLRYTPKSGEPQVGEKDLRLAGAERIPAAKPLFDAWVGLNKAQKAGNMALDVAGFAARSPDGRVHPILSHGPVTGRLSSSEPNSQQFPGDPLFRAIVEAVHGHKIAASDYSALDVRVGAALAIRAQRQIMQHFGAGTLPSFYYKDGPVELRVDVQEIVRQSLSNDPARVRKYALQREQELGEQIRAAADNRQWRLREALMFYQTAVRLGRRLAEVMAQARKLNEPEWSALREAFRLNLDIHTYTALKMTGKDPAELFAGLDKAGIATLQEALKEELGGARKSGKVANLGLLYGMMVAGFRDYANKVFNMGWDYEFAEQVRNQWLDSYPEVDLWHCWTALTPGGKVWVPEPGKNGNVPKDWFAVETLGGRHLIALGLNAALAFPDQGTGADIIGRALQLLREENRPVFDCCINQVHDELVFEMPAAKAEEYGEIIAETMSRAGNDFCMPFGVPINASCLIGDVWLKD